MLKFPFSPPEPETEKWRVLKEGGLLTNNSILSQIYMVSGEENGNSFPDMKYTKHIKGKILSTNHYEQPT